MRTMFASSAFLALLCAAMPAPPADAPSVQLVERGQGFLLVHNLPTPQGYVDALTPWGQPDWARVRLNDGPWSEPVPFNALAGIQAATITFHFCVTYPLVAPYGGVVGIAGSEEYSVTVGGDDVSLEEALALLKAEVSALSAGGFLTQCN